MGDFDLDLDKTFADELKEHERLVKCVTFLGGFMAGVLVCAFMVALARF